MLAAGSAVLLYISYIMPIAAGLLAEGKSWKHFGPFRLGAWSRPVAVLGLLGGAVLAYVGMRPPFQQVAYVVFGLIIALVAVWYALEARRFQGRQLRIFRSRHQGEAWISGWTCHTLSDMQVKLSRHGNSLGVTLPAAVVAALGLKPGISYELETTPDGQLHLAPLVPRRSTWHVSELLEGMPEEPLRYDDVSEASAPVGREQDWM